MEDVPPQPRRVDRIGLFVVRKDCGGIPGSYAMLEVVVHPNHPNHAEAKEWLDEYDPKVIDDLPIKYALSRIANRRNAAKARLANNKQTPSATE